MHVIPTVGRVMWFYPDALHSHRAGPEPLAAMVAAVSTDGLRVNIGYLAHPGTHQFMMSVPVVQPDEPIPEHSHVRWMPYQTAQAQKASARAENQAVAAEELKK